jgi:uncharacterized membrane protein YcaP (DUF421 family)
MLTSWMQDLFGGDVAGESLAPWQLAARVVALYVAGLAIIRIGKNRMLGRATPVDVLLAFMLGSLLSRGINGTAPLTGTLLAAGTMVALHWCFTALTYYSSWWGNLLKGEVRPLISNGEVLWDNLRRAHISENDLKGELRLHANTDDPRTVEAAYEERNGEVGVVKRIAPVRVVEISVREGVQTVRIELS